MEFNRLSWKVRVTGWLCGGLAAWLLGLLQPTLWAAESAKKAAPESTLLFSPPAGVYTNSVKVALKCTVPGAAVRYTLDGTDPNENSPEYTEPMELTADVLLKAKVFKAGAASAVAVSQAYVVMDSALANFNSNLPIIIIDTYGHRVGRDPKTPISVRFIDPKGDRCGLANTADFASLGELNIRGNTSTRFPKKSYHLKTLNEAGESLKAAPLGFPKECDWVLYAPYVDKTLMRDVLGYELSNQIGRYAAKTRFVEMYLNQSGGKLSQGHYMGVYVFEEKIKRDKNRVAVTKLSPEDTTEPNLTGGYIFKKDHTERADNPDGVVPMLAQSLSVRQQRFVSGQGSTFFYVEPKPTEITGPQKSYLRRYVNTVEKAIYGENFRDPKTGYAAYIDVDSFIDHHWLVELSKNIDGFRFSTFYYKDRGGKLCMGPIWDWNLTFGNASPRDGSRPEGWYWPQLDDQQYTWFRRLFDDPDFAQRYIDRWGELRGKQFSTSNLLARVDYWAGVLEEAQARNFKRWRILDDQIWPNSFAGQSYENEIEYLKNFIEKRVRWIDSQFLRAPVYALAAHEASEPGQLELRAKRGEVWYTTDGSDPRAPGGEPSKSAKVMDSKIPLTGPIKIVCRARQEDKWSPPAKGTFGPDTPPTTK